MASPAACLRGVGLFPGGFCQDPSQEEALPGRAWMGKQQSKSDDGLGDAKRCRGGRRLSAKRCRDGARL